MNVGKAIYYLLANAESVTNIAGTRIYPELAEQEAAAPYAVYQIVSVNPDDTNDGPAVIDEVSMDVLCVAESYNEAADLASAVRSALDRVRGTYNGVNVESIQYDSTDSDVQDSPRRYEQTVTLTVRVFRDAAQIATGQNIDQLTLGRLYDVTDDATTGQVMIKQADGTWAAGDQGTGTGGVDSVNGETGIVTLTTDDISDDGQTNKYTTAADITKLAGIEAGAEINPTAAEVKTLYESNADTNAFTDAEQTKLAGIEAGAQVNDVTSVNGEVGDVDVLFIRETVKNVSGSTMYRGTPVHVTGAIGSQAEVIAASASTNYPAHYILDEDINAGASGYAIAIGLISDVDLTPFGDSASNYSEADEVYLGASGGFTTTRPTGTNAVQLLGVVLKVNTGGNQISGYINGMGRVNSLPNLPQGQVWLGNANAAPTATALDTDDVAEGSRLYYTDARADARIAAASVTDLTDVTSAGSGAIITTAERSKLAGIEAGAQVNVATDLTHTTSTLTVRVESSTGSDTTILAASASAAGVMTASDRTKLDGIETGAEVNPTAAEVKTLYESNVDTNAFTDAEQTKLAGIATGAEVNVNADWNAVSGDALILNKPTIPPALADTDDLTEGATNLYYTNTRVQTYLTSEKIRANYPTSTVTGNTSLTSTYEQTMVIGNSATGITFQVSSGLARDCEILVMQYGAGDITITGATGVTIRTTSDFQAVTGGQYAIIGIKQIGTTDEYIVTGERKPV